MIAVRRRWPVVALTLAWALLFTTTPAPAGPAGDTNGSNLETPAQRIRKDLDRTLPTVEIIDQPLKLAIAQLKEQTKINFVADVMTMAQMGIDVEGTPINIKLQNVKLRSALRTIFGPYNLGYAIVGDVVLITSDDMAMHRQMKQRVSIDLDKAQLGGAVKQLAKETATNLVLDARVAKDAQTPVTLQLDDVPLETAVRLMAETAGLKPVRVGNVLYVTSKTTAAELRADPDLAPVPQPRQPGMEDLVVPGVIGGGGMARPVIFPPVGAPAAPAPPAAGGGDKPPAEKPADKPAEKEKPAEKPAPAKDKD